MSNIDKKNKVGPGGSFRIERFEYDLEFIAFHQESALLFIVHKTHAVAMSVTGQSDRRHNSSLIQRTSAAIQ